MADRHNPCPNPALYNNATGWTASGGTSSRTATMGFDVVNVFRALNASYSESPFVPVTALQQYTFSCYMRSDTAVITKQLYIDWYRADTTYINDSVTSYSLSPGMVTRVSITATSPANAAFGRIVPLFGGAATVDMTMVLAEQGAVLGSYFDGNYVDASWDGAIGNSASTFREAAQINRKVAFMSFFE